MIVFKARSGALLTVVAGAMLLTLVRGNAATGDWGDVKRPIVVELFTSQGCSSCPPADMFLAELAADPDIIALSLFVDYWNYLGWRDTLARPENGKRQSAYARRVPPHRRYTPQIIVDGRFNAVGGNPKEVKAAIRKALERGMVHVPIESAFDAQGITLRVAAGPQRSANLFLLCYEDSHEVSIKGGENRGQVMRYADVVNRIEVIGGWTGAAAAYRIDDTAVGRTPGQSCVALLQEEPIGAVLGAARLRP